MPTGVAVSPAMNHGGPYPGHRPPRLHRGRHPGVAAALRGAALLRRRPPAPPAARAREQEPDRQDVAAHRRQLVAAGRRRVTAPASTASLADILGTGELLATTRTKAKGPEGRLPITADMLLQGAERQPVRHDAGRGDGLEPRRGRARAVPDRQHAGRAARARTARRSRSATTPGTGRSACSCARRRETLRAEGVDPVRRVRAAIRATGARRGRRACSTACRTATTRRSRCAG